MWTCFEHTLMNMTELMNVERDWFWFWFWFYYALWLASVFTLVLVLRQSSENRSIQKFLDHYSRVFDVLPFPFGYHQPMILTPFSAPSHTALHCFW